ncbi:MAG: EamA family transporter RarD [Spirulinaceae cyanobacterium SM2_1_0]|nr:EamA family transporter RarD [Spirulinaceae cyanobacterium SM2_1_0]
MAASTATTARAGLLYAALAYGAWGLFPLYWKLFVGVGAVEVLCHRIVWSAVLLLVSLAGRGQFQEFWAIRRSPRLLATLLTTALLLSANWGTYIYGVNTDRVVETSLGYFINPLFSVLLGCLVLREQLTRGQLLAVGLASLGVADFIRELGQVPWIALGLAVSFGLYGLLRKLATVQPLPGLAVETLLVVPLALLWLGRLAITDAAHFNDTPLLMLAFIGCGLVTSLPLLWFNNAARRLPLSTLGFMQYCAPSLQLLLGVFIFHEPFTRTHAISFSLIWLALAIYSAESLQRQLRRPSG